MIKRRRQRMSLPSLCGLILFLLCNIGQLNAQVIINEEMELQEKEHPASNSVRGVNISQTMERKKIESGSVLPLNREKLLVLRDGYLKVAFYDAVLPKPIDPENRPLKISVERNGEKFTKKVKISDFLPSPLVFKGVGFCEELRYNITPFKYEAIDDSKYVKDAIIKKFYNKYYVEGEGWYEEFYGMDKNFQSDILKVNKWGFKSEDLHDYDEYEMRSLIKFDLSPISTNGKLMKADLNLWPLNPELMDPFYLIPINDSWESDKVTWNNQPAVNRGAQKKIGEDYLNDQSLQVELTGLVRSWLNNVGASKGVALFPVELPPIKPGKVEKTETPLYSAKGGFGVRSPKLTLIFENRNEVPEKNDL